MRLMIGLLAISLPIQMYAYQDGRVSGGTTCGGCHGSASTAVTTTITGPATLVAGTSATYTVSITQAAGSAGAGLDVAITTASLAGSTLGVVDANTQLLTGTNALGKQLTHVSAWTDPPTGNLGDWSYSFVVNAPLAAGTIFLNAVMNAYNNDRDSTGDLWDATTFAIQVVLPEPSIALLLGTGVAALVGVGVSRRRRARLS